MNKMKWKRKKQKITLQKENFIKEKELKVVYFVLIRKTTKKRTSKNEAKCILYIG